MGSGRTTPTYGTWHTEYFKLKELETAEAGRSCWPPPRLTLVPWNRPCTLLCEVAPYAQRKGAPFSQSPDSRPSSGFPRSLCAYRTPLRRRHPLTSRSSRDPPECSGLFLWVFISFWRLPVNVKLNCINWGAFFLLICFCHLNFQT